jgi:hypothetical protein
MLKARICSLAVVGVLVHTIFAQTSAQPSGPIRFTPRTTSQIVLPKPPKATVFPRFMGWKHTPNAHENFPRCGSHCLPATPAATQMRNNAARPHSQTPGPPSVLSSFALRPTLPAGAIPTSVATGDFNGDGNIDWVIPDGAYSNIWLYLGQGNGTSAMPTLIPLTGQAPLSVVAVSLRGNGVLDLVVAEADSNTVGVLLGNGNGTFQPEVEYQLSCSPDYLVAADFNGDGNLDIAAGLNSTTDTIAMLPGNGQGQLGTPVYTPTTQQWSGNVLAAADLNGDGKPDLVVLDFALNGGAQVFLNNGNGLFAEGQQFGFNFPASYVPAFQLLSVALADINGDGCPDAVLADTYGLASVYFGNCQGTFPTTASATYAAGDVGASLVLADVNHDGILDIVISAVPLPADEITPAGLGEDSGDQLCILFGEPGGRFAPAQTYRGEPAMFGLAVADLTGSGYPDAITANEGSSSASVYLNDGTGHFGNPQGEAIGNNFGASNAPTSPFLLGDVDGNGTLDLVVLEYPPYPGPLQITTMLNNGSGNFSEPIQSPAFPAKSITDIPGCFLGDFRNTGKLDFLAITFGASFTYFAPNIGAGKFGPGTTTPIPNASAAAVGDFNNDGALDFILVNEVAPSNQIEVTTYFGKANGTFAPGPISTVANGDESQTNARAVVFTGDFNGDGKLDLLFWDGNGLYEFLGNGNGTFSGRTLFPEFGNLALADLNHDGLPDIVSMTDQFGNPEFFVPYISIFLGQPDGTFKYAETYAPYLDSLHSPELSGTLVLDYPFQALIGDFNGDGNVDIAVPQNPSSPDGTDATFIQIMYGNGDGTFTPSYNYALLDKFYVPQFAADLDGDGLADLIELNSYTASFDVIPSTASAPALQLYFRTEPVTGPTGWGVVVLNEASPSSTTVTFTTSDPNVSVPSITIPAGVNSQDFSFSVGNNFNPRNVFSIQAQSGSTTATAYNFVSGQPVPYIELEPTALLFEGVDAGSTSSAQIVTLNNLGAAPLPISSIGIANDFNQTNNCGAQISVGGSCTFQITLQAHPGLSFGSMDVWDTLDGLGQGVDLQGFGSSLQLYPCCMSFSQAVGSTSSPQIATVINELSTPETIAVGDFYPSDQGFTQTNTCSKPLAPGGTCQISVSFAPFSSGSTMAVLYVYQNGLASLSINATGTGSDFNVNCISPCNQTINAGEIADFKGYVDSVDGFAGLVTLSCSGAPAESTCTINPGQVMVANSKASGFTVEVKTTANSSSSISPLRDDNGPSKYLRFAFITLPLLFCVGTRASVKRGLRMIILPFVLILCCCGGGSGSAANSGGTSGTGGSGRGGTGGGGSGGGTGGTPAGTYILHIDGKDAYGISAPYTMNVAVVVK